jgi:endogenous inhibitor of DNA gyrase (YacG/DUF329 family)
MAYFNAKITCPICNRRCGYERPLKFFCSQKCKRISLGEQPIINNRAFIKCANCDLEFQPTKASNIYCSKECGSIYHKQKIKSTSEFSIFERDDFRCVYCGKSSIEHNVELHVDHIYPLVFDGIAEIDNLITACKSCNVSKNARILSDEVMKRLIDVLFKRNNSLSPVEYLALKKQISAIQMADCERKFKLKPQLK